MQQPAASENGNVSELRGAQTPAQAEFDRLREHLEECVLGQPVLIDRLLIALLSNGHLLVEGAPGLAKTTAVKAVAAAIDADYHRIQFTPDLLPADVTGSDVYEPESGTFRFRPGPVFHNLVLADEVNRAPAKVQSALLEAMGEHHVTVGQSSYPLPELFLVMATQNPIEHEGTYPLPEAQLDRFLMHVRVGHPDAAVEREIMQLVRNGGSGSLDAFPRIPQRVIFEAREEVEDVYLSPSLEDYVAHLVVATRDPSPFAPELAGQVAWGASPRATIALDRCSRARAWLRGRNYVSPEDLHDVVGDILRHRVLLSFEAQAEGRTPDAFVETLVAAVPLP